MVGGWQGRSGRRRAPRRGRRPLPLRPHRSPAHRGRLPDARTATSCRDGRRRPITTANSRAWAHALALHADRRRDLGAADGDAGRARRADRQLGARSARRAPRSRARAAGGDPRARRLRRADAVARPARGRVPRVLARGAAGAGPDAVRPETQPSTTRRACASRQPRLRLEAIGFFNDYQNLTSICTFVERLPGRPGRTCSPTPAAPTSTAPSSSPAPTSRSAPGYAIPLHRRATRTRGRSCSRASTLLDPTLGDVRAGRRAAVRPAPPGARRRSRSRRRARRWRWRAPTCRRCASTPGRGRRRCTEPFTDPSFILDVTARVPVTRAGHVYCQRAQHSRRRGHRGALAVRRASGRAALGAGGDEMELLMRARHRRRRTARPSRGRSRPPRGRGRCRSRSCVSIGVHAALIVAAVAAPARSMLDDAPVTVEIVEPGRAAAGGRARRAAAARRPRPDRWW